MTALYPAKILALAALLYPVATWAQSSVDTLTEGTGNDVIVRQSSALDSRVNVQQIGMSNQVSVHQSGSDNLAEVMGGGANNSLAIRQSGTGAKHIIANVSGNDHFATITQSGIDGNEAALIQSGAFNQAFISQNNPGGAVNFINLLQSGAGNIASLEQDGAGNAIDLAQTGDDNNAAITQIGDGFGIAINQTGGATIAITQSAP
jgi:hypothetical protein